MMKKNLQLILFTLILSFSFVSCSSDEEETGKDTKDASQFIASLNYTKFETYYTTEEEASYTTSPRQLNISFDFGTERFEMGDVVYVRGYYGLRLKFPLDINTLKVGDELQAKLAEDDGIKFTDYATLGSSTYENYVNGGKMIVKSIDMANKKISIEFQNLDVWKNQHYLNGNSQDMKNIMFRSGILEFKYK